MHKSTKKVKNVKEVQYRARHKALSHLKKESTKHDFKSRIIVKDRSKDATQIHYDTWQVSDPKSTAGSSESTATAYSSRKDCPSPVGHEYTVHNPAIPSYPYMQDAYSLLPVTLQTDPNAPHLDFQPCMNSEFPEPSIIVPTRNWDTSMFQYSWNQYTPTANELTWYDDTKLGNLPVTHNANPMQPATNIFPVGTGFSSTYNAYSNNPLPSSSYEHYPYHPHDQVTSTPDMPWHAQSYPIHDFDPYSPISYLPSTAQVSCNGYAYGTEEQREGYYNTFPSNFEYC